MLLRVLLTLALIAAGILIMNLPRIVKTRRVELPSLDPVFTLEDSGAIPRDSLPTDSARVMDALDEVDDPELGFSIVELGLVHRLAVDSLGNAGVLMTLTMPECPFSRFLGEQALEAVAAVPGVRRVKVTVDPSIPWDPARLAGEARERYRSVFGNDPGNGR